MKLLGSTENKITKDKKGENVPHSEITEDPFIHCNLVNNSYQQSCTHLFRINHLINYFSCFLFLSFISPNFLFLKTIDTKLSYIET